MKKHIQYHFVFLLIGFTSIINGQINEKTGNKSKNLPSFGFTVNQIDRDFGMGSCITSPYFYNRSFAVRINYSRNWLEHLNDAGKYVWSDYQNARVGLVAVGGIILKHIRLYGEGGITNIFGFRALSDRRYSTAAYGVIGFEFLFQEDQNGSYFIELGGMGSGLRANQVAGNPFIGQGFILITGFRI